MKNQKTKGDILIDAISRVINLVNLGWWKNVIEPKPDPDTNPNLDDLREALLASAKSISEYQSPKVGEHIKTSIWHHPDLSGRVIRAICEQQKFTLPEEAVAWVLEQYEYRPLTWEFNHCNRPKYWFGDRLQMGETHIGIVRRMEYRDEESGGSGKTGWWYGMRWRGRSSVENVHQDSLIKLSPLSTNPRGFR